MLEWACVEGICGRRKMLTSSVLEGACSVYMQESCRATVAMLIVYWRWGATWQLYCRQPPPSWPLSSLVCPKSNFSYPVSVMGVAKVTVVAAVKALQAYSVALSPGVALWYIL